MEFEACLYNFVVLKLGRRRLAITADRIILGSWMLKVKLNKKWTAVSTQILNY